MKRSRPCCFVTYRLKRSDSTHTVCVTSSSRPLSYLVTFLMLLHSEWLSGQLRVISCIYWQRWRLKCNYKEVYGGARVKGLCRRVCVCVVLPLWYWIRQWTVSDSLCSAHNLECFPRGLAFAICPLATIISNYTTHRQLLSIENLAVDFLPHGGPNKIFGNV